MEERKSLGDDVATTCKNVVNAWLLRAYIGNVKSLSKKI
jgi:hypothetical protein